LPVAEEIRLSDKDTEILRRLAGEVAQIAVLPVHNEKAQLWTKLNDLQIFVRACKSFFESEKSNCRN